MLGAGLSFWMGGTYAPALLMVVAMLAINWFGDSLDGTLARVRRQERPRYGFYVDHVLDVLGILFLFAGLAAGGFISPLIAAGFLLAYYLLTIEIALAAHTVGTFKISYWKIGPTELRLLFAAGTLQFEIGIQTFEPAVNFDFHWAMPMPAIYHLEHDGIGWRVMGGHGFTVGPPTIH